jgi:high-affinity nickel permease
MLVKLLGLLTTGFFLGRQHSLDADHMAAVSTIASKNLSLKRSLMILAAIITFTIGIQVLRENRGVFYE